MTERVSLAVEDGLARLTLVRPEGRNAIDPLWVEEFGAAVAAVAADEWLRALLITAEGPTFSVGGDLDHFAAAGAGLADALEAMVRPFHEALAALDELEVPVVTAMQGAAAGGALGLAYVADIVLVADDLRLATGFARIGLSGDGGGSWHLPRLVGLRRAQMLLVEGRVLDAATAVEWGIASRAVAPEGLQGEALAVARRLASGPTSAYREMRRLLRSTTAGSAREQLQRELEAMTRLGATEDAQRAIQAFARR